MDCDDMNRRAPVTKIQRFSTHDGPGVRTTVFFKGCPLRCAWCHNPETQSFAPQIFYTARLCVGCGACAAACPTGAHAMKDGGHVYDAALCRGCMACARVCPARACEPCATEMTVEEIMKAVRRDLPFYGAEGGLTLSGGEPMAHPEAALALLAAAKREGIPTAVETCGFFPAKWRGALAARADLLLWDCKDSDEARHVRFTGVSARPILDNLRAVDALGARVRLRCVMVRTVNMEEAHYEAVARLAASLSHCEGVDLLPYHPYGGSKAEQLGRADNGNTAWIPEPDALRQAVAYLRARGVDAACEGAAT